MKALLIFCKPPFITSALSAASLSRRVNSAWNCSMLTEQKCCHRANHCPSKSSKSTLNLLLLRSNSLTAVGRIVILNLGCRVQLLWCLTPRACFHWSSLGLRSFKSPLGILWGSHVWEVMFYKSGPHHTFSFLTSQPSRIPRAWSGMGGTQHLSWVRNLRLERMKDNVDDKMMVMISR